MGGIRRLYNIPATGIVGLNLSQIASGSATASIAPDTGFQINTNTIITGSLTVTGGVTASLYGTASWALNSVTSSYAESAVTASYLLGGVTSASFATTASYAVTASYVDIGAITLINPIVQYYDTTSSILAGSTVTLPGGLTFVSSSQFEYIEIFINGLRLRYDRDFFPISTASYVENAQTASYVLNAVSASYAPDITFPYTGSAQITGSLGITGSLDIGSIFNVNSNAGIEITSGRTIIPSGNRTLNLGSGTRHWQNVYTQFIRLADNSGDDQIRISAPVLSSTPDPAWELILPAGSGSVGQVLAVSSSIAGEVSTVWTSSIISSSYALTANLALSSSKLFAVQADNNINYSLLGSTSTSTNYKSIFNPVGITFNPTSSLLTVANISSSFITASAFETNVQGLGTTFKTTSSGSIILPITSSNTPGYTGQQGEMFFGSDGSGNYVIWAYLGGAWRSGSLF